MSAGVLDGERPDKSISAAAALSDTSLQGFVSSAKCGGLLAAAAQAVLHLHRKETEG